MTIAFDASTSSTSTSFTHTPVGTPRAIVILATGPNSGGSLSSVSYGGVALTKIRHDELTSGAQSQSEIWLLGAGVPTGAQTVLVTYGGFSEVTVVSFTANSDVSSFDSDGGNGTASTISALLSYFGKTSIAVVAGAPHNAGSPLAGETVLAAGGHFNGQYWHGYQTVSGSSDFTAGLSQSSSNYAFTVAALTPAVIVPFNIDSEEAFGSLGVIIEPQANIIGISSGEAFGAATISITGNQFLSLGAIPTGETVSTPSIQLAGSLVIWGDGTLYGQGIVPAPTYGPISNALAAAEQGFSRETGLKVSIINERINHWEYFAGTTMNGRELWRPVQFTSGARKAFHQDYWSYRGSSATVKLTNGNIVRVRNSDSADLSSRVIQIQTITDPTVASQWEAWSTLYSGTHYCCYIVPSGTTYDVYHSKSDGLYKNNSLVWSHAGIIGIRAVEGQPKAVFVMVTLEDPIDGAGRYRDIDLYYTPNIDSTAPVADPTNYRWSRNYIEGFLRDNGKVARFQSNSWYFNPRLGDRGNAIVLQDMPSFSDNTPGPPRVIRGIGGGSNGRNYCAWPFVRKLSDGYYYLFYVEIHEDNSFDFVSNFSGPAVWQRSKDLRYWSEPTIVGFNGWNFNNIIEHSGYVWLVDNGSVWRRPSTSSIRDLSNYVPEMDFSIPRDNQAGSGTCLVANPAGINDSIISLGDREIKIEIGIKVADGTYEFHQFNRWFVTEPTRQIESITGANRITLPFGDLWTRLKNPLRDTYNLIGKLEWADWQVGSRNRAFNYFFVADASPVENTLNASDLVDKPYTLTTKGNVVFTGWKGHNGTTEVQLSSITVDVNFYPAVIYRYVDELNYYRIQNTGSTYQLVRKRGNVETILASGGGGGFGKVKVEFRWAVHKVYLNGSLLFTHTETVPGSKPGYVGFSASAAATVSNFSAIDYEDILTTEDLVRLSLALGDFHDVVVGGAESKQLAVTWGPQTDIPTPADALLAALTAEKLQLVWRNGIIEIGKFTDNSVKKVIQDTIIQTDYIDSAVQRINFAAVDGNADSWLEFDAVDIRDRDRQINAYFDLPELTDAASVRARAQEEIRRSVVGRSPGGSIILFFDLWRMDVITWIDSTGLSTNVRIEGMDISVNQSKEPKQVQQLDTSLIDYSSTPLISPDSGTPQ